MTAETELETRIERLEEVAERWDRPGNPGGRRIARRARDKADGMRAARRLIAQARREGAAEELDRQAYAITPGDHHCFKPWCPHCQARKIQEQARDGLHARAAALRGDPK